MFRVLVPGPSRHGVPPSTYGAGMVTCMTYLVPGDLGCKARVMSWISFWPATSAAGVSEITKNSVGEYDYFHVVLRAGVIFA